MGADIHVFGERRDASGWLALADGEFPVSRDYRLFSALAGVRGPDEPGHLFPPRGLPNNISSGVSDRFFIPVVEDARALGWGIGEHATPSRAQVLTSTGESIRLLTGMAAPLIPATHGYISRPDWHTPSWLELAEVTAALEHAGYPEDELQVDFVLVLDWLRAIESRLASQTRLVFWFDN